MLFQGIFVTGTDTGVGKTVVSTMLTLAGDALYWKPIQAGLEGPTDTELVKQWSQLPDDRFLRETYRLRMPASPHLAALAQGMRIELQHFQLPETDRQLVIEGAGGVFVPLNEKQLMVDLIRYLHQSVIVVARSTLGTINHTLMTLEALRRREVPIIGVIVNGPENLENERAIERYGRTRVLGWLPPLEEINPDTLVREFRLRVPKQSPRHVFPGHSLALFK
jgi:dethiobiotin synthase